MFFFFQAEDGIRDKLVTGVQTCALPILERFAARGWEPRFVGGLTLGADPVAYAIAAAARAGGRTVDAFTVRKQPKAHGAARRIEGCFAAGAAVVVEIGRASCRERV